MYDEKLKIAYEKSDEFSKLVKNPDNEMITIQSAIEAVKSAGICKEIEVLGASFSKIEKAKNHGAMMKVEFDSESNLSKAIIILNTDKGPHFQRFSFFHEIGHLVTGTLPTDRSNSGYVVSTHINYQITSISEDDYKDNEYLTNEQIANIFALRVLMPKEKFYNIVEEYDDLADVASYFGVTKDAVISRMWIGA